MKQTQRPKGRVTRTMIQNGMKILDKNEVGLKKNLEADTETEREGDEDDDPGHSSEKPAADADAVFCIVR